MRSGDQKRSKVALVAAFCLALICFADGLVFCMPEEERESVPVPGRIILLSIDTLRQDHLSVYGYPRPTTPNMERLAGSSVLFTNAMAQAPYTLPSHMSMLTGLNPWTHGVRHADDALPESVLTLADSLKEAGYATAAFVDCSFLHRRHGFDQGFDLYDDARAEGGALKNGFRRYGARVNRWIQEHRDQPFFLFLHTFDTHGPYEAEPRYREMLADTEPVVPPGSDRLGEPMSYLRSLGYHDYFGLDKYETLGDLIDDYDATIRFVDEMVGQLIFILEQADLLEDSLIVITSDHGESFMDHQMYVGHGLTLYEEEVRVPLLIHYPGQKFAGRRCDEVVRLIDLFPTITRAAGASCPPTIQGEDVLLALEGLDREPRIAMGVSPNLGDPKSNGTHGVMAYVRRQGVKYIEAPGIGLERILWSHLDREAMRERGREYDLEGDPLRMRDRIPFEPQLFFLDADPGEAVNQAPERVRDVGRIRARLLEERQRDINLGKIVCGDGVSATPFTSEDQLDDLYRQGYLSSDQLARLKEELRLRERLKEDGGGDR